MKGLTLLSGALLIVFSLSCNRSVETGKVSFDSQWRFKTGDDLAWASPELNDSGWDSIDPQRIWEEQGYKKVDGFGWYRVKVRIPSSLKTGSFFKDSLQIDLGRIDDCDQVFLNGQLIGTNGRTFVGSTVPAVEFFNEHGHWNEPRSYRIASGDPRIRWDAENTLAIRVFDQGGAGGVFSGPFAIAMTGLKDRVKFDLDGTAFTFQGDSVIGKNIIVQNHTSKEEFRGTLKVEIIRTDNHDRIFLGSYAILLSPASKQEFPISVKMDLTRASVMKIAFHEETSGETLTQEVMLPYILTPVPQKTPRINGARVFGVRPNAPFMFKVPATGELPLKYTASDLPEGLKINERTGVITGSVKKRGEYVVLLRVENRLAIAERSLRIVVGDLISLTPPMGWNSWNCWGLSVSDRRVRESAGEMASSGLIDHGWSYINIDDGWEDKHDDKGRILTNAKFPNMWGLCDYVHSLGLKIGIYSSPGPKTCGGYEGSYGFEEKDAQAYANWGFDYLKYDWCSYWNIAPNPTLDQMKRPYLEMERALRRTGRDIHYSLCQYGMGEVWKWGAEVNGNSWRTTGDITDTWESLSTIGFSQNKCSPYAAPGRWNDPDMLVVGWVGWGPDLHYTRLTPDEQYTHITLWSLLAAPLLIGCDLKQLDPFTLNLLTNDEVLAVNQDPLGIQASQVKKTDAYEIWVRDLEDGSKAIGLFNKTEKPLNIPVVMADLLLEGKYGIRDLWRQYDLGWVKSQFEMRTGPHGARMILLSKPDPSEV
jgi:alpha-galactosidase